jgi:hypothetical protein
VYGNIGFLHGLWVFRRFVPQSPIEAAKSRSEPAVELGKVP